MGRKPDRDVVFRPDLGEGRTREGRSPAPHARAPENPGDRDERASPKEAMEPEEPADKESRPRRHLGMVPRWIVGVSRARTCSVHGSGGAGGSRLGFLVACAARLVSLVRLVLRAVCASRVARSLALLPLLVAALGSTACYSVPQGKHAVSGVSIGGTQGIDTDEIEERIATRETPKFLGLFPGVYEYETFDRYALNRDLERIERYLRARGYYEAEVRAARVTQDGNKVRVAIEIEQGVPVNVKGVGIAPNEPLDPGTEEDVRKAIASELPIGRPLDEDKLDAAEKNALHALTANGYAAAKIERKAEVDLATHTATLRFSISPGPLAKFGAVSFEGLGGIAESDVRRVFGITEGTLYSSDAVDDGKQALLGLGVFTNVEIDADMAKIGETARVPIHVKAEPAKVRSILTGVGFELDNRKADIHGQIGWTHANFLGGLRKFDIRYRPGVVFYPTRFPNFDPPNKLLYEQKIIAELRQPALFEKRTTGLIRAEYNMEPLLLPTITKTVFGYHEIKTEIGVERTFLKHLFVSPQYGFQANYPISYIGETDGVDRILISYVELETVLDYRDNPVKPRRGFMLGNRGQFAGGPLLGDARDVRVQPDARLYVPLPKKVTLAFRGAIGLLFPMNYGEAAESNFRHPGPSSNDAAENDYQVLFFRGFFGGGPSSNRGYPIRGVSPHIQLPYLSPAGQSSAAACDPAENDNNPSCKLPTGGVTQWEVNAEVRFVVAGPFSAAFFCDAGDVSPFRYDFRFDRLHLSCGSGGRYDTPVGAIRLDVGARIPGLQFPKNDPWELEPEALLGLPIAIAFGIGEAF